MLVVNFWLEMAVLGVGVEETGQTVVYVLTVLVTTGLVVYGQLVTVGAQLEIV